MVAIKRKTIFIVAILFLSLFRIYNATPTTIYVDDDGTADFTSIQDAINNALNGDTIIVRAGTYREEIFINKSITLKGEAGAIIECLPDAHGITLNANGVIVDGFLIRYATEGHYCLKLNNARNCIIKNCNFSSSYGAIYIYGGENNTILRNRFYSNNYGIIAIGAESMVFRENFFIKNLRGIDMGLDTRYNIFYYNNFINNTLDAYDESTFNQWYYQNVGNYWDKYNGVDSDGDGIGDDPYPIEPLEKGNFDYYPLMENYTGIDIFPPDIINLKAIPQIQEPGKYVNISCKIIDNVKVNCAYLNITFPNSSFLNISLNNINSTDIYYYNASFSIKGTYYYYVWANDTNNNSERSSLHKFVIAYKPVALFNHTPLNPTRLDIVTFDASASYDTDATGGGIVNYTWDFGDGSIAYGKIVQHQYAENATFTVTLTVYDADGAWDNISKEIIIRNIPPVANFTFYPTEAIVGETIYFNDSSYDLDGKIYIWQWNFGDGSIVKGGDAYKNVSHSYSVNGIFNVTLTVWDNDYANATITKQIVVIDIYPPKIINLTAYPNPQEVNEEVNISCHIVDDVAVKEAWINITMPNGSYINQSMLNTGDVYFYNIRCTIGGNYSYYIWTKDMSNNTNKSAIKTFQIVVPPAPPSIFNVSYPSQQQYGYGVNISCYVTDNVGVAFVKINVSLANGYINQSMIGIVDEKGNGIYYFNWTFDMGIHYFYIYAEDINGYGNTTSAFTFEIIDTLPPSIENISYPNVAEPGFINISCDVLDNRGVDLVFINITMPNATHLNMSMKKTRNTFYINKSFNLSGNYSFFIYAIDLTNNSAKSLTYSFKINSPPFSNFTWSPSMPYAFQNITFNASSSYDIDGFIINYTWDFNGDGIIDAITDNPVIIYSYSNDGIYNVTLTVYDNDGFNSTITKQITILNNPPVANFSFMPINPKTNENITFNASSSYDIDGFITNYTWDFGDGSIAYGKIVQHSYSKDGIYNVTLTIYDDDGSIATITKKVNVRAIIANFTWTPLDAVSKEQIQFIDLSQGATQWQWNFGDGSYAYEENPIHIYVIGNYYNVTLTIFNGSINTSISKLVKVNHKVELYKNENNVVNYVAWLSDATTASQLALLIGNDIMPKGSVISKWNVSKGAFDSYIVGISPPSYDFVIEPGDCVVLRVASSGSFIMEVMK